MYIVFATGHWFSRVDTRNTRCQSDQSMTESPFSENGQRARWLTSSGDARHVARRLCRRLHVARPRSRRGPAPARTRSPLHFPLSPSPRAAPCPQQLRHCRPRVAIIVRARHRENKSPSPLVASPWSSLPSPPHRRSNRVLVRTNASFSSTAAVAVLAGDGAPHGQLSSHPCHPSSVSR